MAGKSRVPMQVSLEFENRIKKLQEKIMKKHGRNISLREITERVVKTPTFDELENTILNIDNMDFKIKFDKRRKK